MQIFREVTWIKRARLAEKESWCSVVDFSSYLSVITHLLIADRAIPPATCSLDACHDSWAHALLHRSDLDDKC